LLKHRGSGAERRNEGTGLDEEGVQGLLEGGDGRVGVGEGGLEMCEDVCGLGPACGFGGRRRRWAAAPQCRADVALAEVEPLPEALVATVAQLAVDGAAGGDEAVDGGALQEAPQTAGSQAKPSDFVSEPDADRATATGSSLALAAQEAACAVGSALGTGVVKSVQRAVANQGAHRMAVGTGRQLEALDDGVPVLVVPVKPWLFVHWEVSRKMVIVPGGRGGV
jgi:hypothetical protein